MHCEKVAAHRSPFSSAFFTRIIQKTDQARPGQFLIYRIPKDMPTV
jgi:hypothetical protein